MVVLEGLPWSWSSPSSSSWSGARWRPTWSSVVSPVPALAARAGGRPSRPPRGRVAVLGPSRVAGDPLDLVGDDGGP